MELARRKFASRHGGWKPGDSIAGKCTDLPIDGAGCGVDAAIVE